MSEGDEIPYAFIEASGGRAPGRSISVGALAWLLVGGVFVALRLGAAFEAPVGGAELAHLSGAWNAHLGISDSRYVPSLFQSLTALLLHLSDSELPARLLSVAAAAMVPFATYLLRPRLGEAGALLTLLVLAFDPLGILLGGTATAMGFDTAIALWFFVLVERPLLPAGGVPTLTAIAAAAFLVTTGGSLVLPVAVAWALLMLVRRPSMAANELGATVAGALAGFVLTSLLAGEPRVAPFALFSAGFEQRWSAPVLGEVVTLYLAPIVIAGTILALFELRARLQLGTRLAPGDLLLGWGIVAGIWVLVSVLRHNFVPAAGLSTPLALFIGPALARWAKAVRGADWSLARFFVPAVFVLLLLAMAIALRWARDEAPGDTAQKTRMAFILAGAAGGIVAVMVRRAAWPAAATVAVVVGGLLMAVNSFGIAVQAAAEPLPSPFEPPIARDMRDRALAAQAKDGGTIVIHDSLRNDATWAFRDSGTVVFATRVPIDAAFVVWPAGLAAPDGMRSIDGNFALTTQVHTPLNDPLDYLHWLLERNTLAIRPAAVAVYTRAGQ